LGPFIKVITWHYFNVTERGVISGWGRLQQEQYIYIYIYTLVIKCHGQELRARSCGLMATHRLYI